MSSCTMSENKNDKAKVDLGLLEEDDEFEEFPAEGNNLILQTINKASLQLINMFIRHSNLNFGE